jgi:hypothetical protein
MNNYLIYQGEYDHIIIGIFSDLKTFVDNYIKSIESREGENNKYIRHKFLKDSKIIIEFNYGKLTFYYQQLETNKIY